MKKSSVKSKNVLMLLGAGELGKEVVIAAQRLGKTVIAVDKYVGAPAMQVADDCEVINMLDGEQLERIVAKHKPDIIIPEIEAIRTDKLKGFERKGITVVPTAEATHLTMNRDVVRDVASCELNLKTAKFAYASNLGELKEAVKRVGFPFVIKPVMSSSGKGQSVVQTERGVTRAWQVACKGMRGNIKKVIIEEFIKFDIEITVLTVKQHKGKTLFLPPIGHRQERGDYQESWIPADITETQLRKAHRMAKKITDRLGGAGIFGVEFFVTKEEVYFSELSSRPHDTGMVTLISQDLSEFDLHVRAILGLPIPKINYFGPAASAVILSDKNKKTAPTYTGVEKALAMSHTDVRIFGKPTARKFRRMGVVLARGTSTNRARKLAKKAADCVKVE